VFLPHRQLDGPLVRLRVEAAPHPAIASESSTTTAASRRIGTGKLFMTVIQAVAAGPAIAAL
jgi:hypothetical protein